MSLLYIRILHLRCIYQCDYFLEFTGKLKVLPFFFRHHKYIIGLHNFHKKGQSILKYIFWTMNRPALRRWIKASMHSIDSGISIRRLTTKGEMVWLPTTIFSCVFVSGLFVCMFEFLSCGECLYCKFAHLWLLHVYLGYCHCRNTLFQSDEESSNRLVLPWQKHYTNKSSLYFKSQILLIFC